MRSVRFFVLLIVFALIAAACSSADEDTTTTPTEEATTTAVATETTTTAAPAEPEDPTGPLGIVLIPNGIDDNPICGYDGDEIVTPAPLDVVRQTLAELDLPVAVGALVRDGHDDFPYELPVGLNAYVLAALDPGVPGPSPVDVSAALLSAGIPASPRHLVMPAARWKFGPFDDAAEADEPSYGNDPDVVGGTVVVIDTGSAPSPFLGAFSTEWDGIFTASDPVAPEPQGIDSRLVGHGVFVAGIVRGLMPTVSISVRSAMYSISETAAIFDEHSVISNIDDALDKELSNGEGGVVNLSLGTYVCEPNHIPLELAVFLGGIAASTEHPAADTVFVAAAGNDDEGPEGAPFWPAGFADSNLIDDAMAQWDLGAMDDWPIDTAEQDETIVAFKESMNALISRPIVVGVGALQTGSETPAHFSNVLAVTVWAPGTDIASTYPGWGGFASWSGTSFAAPFVSAMIAGCRGGGSTYRDSLAQFIADPPLTLTDPTCP